jgi:WD40 repeat protein
MIVIEGHLVVTEKQDVPSTRAGQILFIGEEIGDMETPSAGPVYTAKVLVGGKWVARRYRRLEEGSLVKVDQMVAKLDYSIALNDLLTKKAKIDAARADYDAAVKTKLEAHGRLERLKLLMAQGIKGAVAYEEYSAAVLTRDRYQCEEEAKKQAITQAMLDADQAQINLMQHDIRTKMLGTSILKTIYKGRGEAVKENEPILHLYNIDRLRAEGLVGVQFLGQLRAGSNVSLEPIEEESPVRVLNEHRAEVTSVAVSGPPANPLIVSGSTDGTVRVWTAAQARAMRVLDHPAPVRVVACSPPGCKQRWMLSGCADGSIRLWDLDRDVKQPVWDSTGPGVENPHREAITALAFSPDGRWFASGAEDSSMCLWQTDSGRCRLLYPFDQAHCMGSLHQGDITALHFTPQCQLVSASRDNTLRIWKLREKGAHLVGEPITERAGSVPHLGVSGDGRFALLDKGNVLQVIALADRGVSSLLQNPSGTTPFETLALFSPDARLILTAGTVEGRLQLWRAPAVGKRGFEVRQFVAGERSAVTCAAFAPDAGVAPDGSFAVSGTKDGHVYVWPVPSRDKVSRHRMEGLKLTLIERSLDASTEQVRVGVNVQNPIDDDYPAGRLNPGRPVNIVIEPD